MLHQPQLLPFKAEQKAFVVILSLVSAVGVNLDSCPFVTPPAQEALASAALQLLQVRKTSAVAPARRSRFRKGSPDELLRDPLFTLAWAPAPEERPAVQVGAEDDCRSWEGNPECYIETPEHTLVKKWIPHNATVMEFGSRFGTTTCEIMRKLKDGGQVVTVEPDSVVWGFLENNLKQHNCYAHVVRGAISTSPLRMTGSGYGGRSQSIENPKAGEVAVPTFTFDEVEKSLGLKIDTLLIDCEGCAQDMMDQIGPKLQQQINLVLIEADMPDTGGDCEFHCMNYPKFFKFLTDAGFEEVDSFNDCDQTRSHAPAGTLCGSWINHFAFKRVPRE